MGSSLLPVLGVIVAALALILFFIKKSPKVSAVTEINTSSSSSGASSVSNKVTLDPQADAAHLANALRPNSTPLEILYAIATTPDNLAMTQKSLDMAANLRVKKIAHLAKLKNEAEKGIVSNMEDLLSGDDGWADDDDDDPAAAAAKKAKEEKAKEAAQLAKATGKAQEDVNKIKLEGVDEGVLGQEWVTSKLTEMKAWPPPQLDEFAQDRKFSLNGKACASPLDHPAVKRNLLMTMGRLHAKQLNTHPELAKAGPQGLIDPTYFQSTMEYRQRMGMLLEASLRMACTLRSFTLAQSVLDAMVMFKIGVLDVSNTKELAWFKELMAKQYGVEGSPKLQIQDKYLGVPTPPEEKPNAEQDASKSEEEKQSEAQSRNAAQAAAVALCKSQKVTTTDEKMALEMQITRQHAEAFTKEKLAMCQKQGIPPQIGLQAYRESWFIIVRAKKLNVAKGEKFFPSTDKCYGTNHMETMKKSASEKEESQPLYQMLNDKTRKSFESHFGEAGSADMAEKKIVVGWPFVISNVAQKAGRVKIQLPPPSEAGKYEFVVTIKSQDFLGADEEVKMVVDVVEGEKKADESKKDK